MTFLVTWDRSSILLHLPALLELNPTCMRQVYTWGHRLVTPKRVVVARNLKKSGNTTLKFHRKERLHVVSIAAGVVHSMALTDDGALFYWVSSDPDLRCHQVYFMKSVFLLIPFK